MIWNCETFRLRMTKCAINTMIPNFSRSNSIIEPRRLGKCLLHLLRQYHLFHDGTYVDQNNISVFLLKGTLPTAAKPSDRHLRTRNHDT